MPQRKLKRETLNKGCVEPKCGRVNHGGTSAIRKRSAKSLALLALVVLRTPRFAEWAAVPSSSASSLPPTLKLRRTSRDIAELSDMRHVGLTTPSSSRHDRISAAQYIQFESWLKEGQNF